MTACCCLGPQNGEPVCPCRMKNVKIIDGRWVEVIDLGPAPHKTELDRRRENVLNYTYDDLECNW